MEILILLGWFVLIAAGLALLLKFVRQPPIVSYLIVGLCAGVLDIQIDSLGFLTELGIVLLLFTAGLKMNIKEVKALGRNTLMMGLGHDIFIAMSGFLTAILFGFSLIHSTYIGIGITLASTIVVVKVLTQRKELSSPHGQILMGRMILQDIEAMFFLMVVSSLGAGVISGVGISFIKIIFAFVVFYLTGKYILSEIFSCAAESIELVFLTGLAWCFAGILAAHFLGFSIAIGAFIAGLSISHLPFTFEITDKVRSLQDFGIMLFFISVGLAVELTLEIFTQPIFYVLIFIVFTLSPVVTSFIARLQKFGRKENFILSVIPMQVSEFTLIILTVGLQSAQISKEIFSILTVAVIITLMISASFLPSLNKIYRVLEPKLRFLESVHRSKKRRAMSGHVVILGFKRLGQLCAKHFKKDVVIVEWRSELLKKAENYSIIYGDAGDSDLWDEINMHKAKVVISTIGENQEDDIRMLNWLKRHKSGAFVVVETNDEEEAQESYDAGADHVLVHDNLEWKEVRKILKKVL